MCSICTCFLRQYIYIYIYVYIYNIFYIILTSFFITLLNLAAIYIYNILYIILTSFCYIIECAPVVLVSCGNIYIYLYMYVYIKHILYNTNIFFISLLNAFQLYLFRPAIYI